MRSAFWIFDDAKWHRGWMCVTNCRSLAVMQKPNTRKICIHNFVWLFVYLYNLLKIDYQHNGAYIVANFMAYTLTKTTHATVLNQIRSSAYIYILHIYICLHWIRRRTCSIYIFKFSAIHFVFCYNKRFLNANNNIS